MWFYKGKILSIRQLQCITAHKYNSVNSSILDPYLQPWWNFLVQELPLWLAPNLITIVGLVLNIVTTLLLVWYSPDAKQEAPRWTYAVCALGLFLYQTLDAIDGKQARRTCTSSPLGELFDHGCDSISAVFVGASACIAVQLGHYPSWMFLVCFFGVAVFYCAHWKTYITGTMQFGKLDVTEGQLSIIAIHMISAVFGPNIWMTEVPILWDGCRVNHVLCCVFFLCYTLFVFQLIMTLLEARNQSSLPYEENVTGQTFHASIFSPGIPLCSVLIPAYIIYRMSVTNVYENHPAVYIIAFGMVGAKVTNRLIIAHMTKHTMKYADSTFCGPAMLVINQYFDSFLPDYLMLWLCLIWATCDLVCYSLQVCEEICNHLSIELFRIPVTCSPHRPYYDQTLMVPLKYHQIGEQPEPKSDVQTDSKSSIHPD